MPEQNLHQDIGELRGRLHAMENRIESLEKDIDMRLDRMERDFSEKLGQLMSIASEVRDNQTAVKGGWKALTILFSVMATFSAAVAWLVDHFRG